MRNVLMLVVVVCTIIMGSSSSHAQQLLKAIKHFSVKGIISIQADGD